MGIAPDILSTLCDAPSLVSQTLNKGCEKCATLILSLRIVQDLTDVLCWMFKLKLNFVRNSVHLLRRMPCDKLVRHFMCTFKWVSVEQH